MVCVSAAVLAHLFRVINTNTGAAVSARHRIVQHIWVIVPSFWSNGLQVDKQKNASVDERCRHVQVTLIYLILLNGAVLHKHRSELVGKADMPESKMSDEFNFAPPSDQLPSIVPQRRQKQLSHTAGSRSIMSRSRQDS